MSVLPQGQFLLIIFFLVYGTYVLVSLHISIFKKLDTVSVIMWQLLEIRFSPLKVYCYCYLLFSDFLN